MAKQFIWQPWTTPGVQTEHLYLEANARGLDARGVIIMQPGADDLVRLHYTIVCDRDGRTRDVRVWREGQGQALVLRHDGSGRWLNHRTEPLPELDGCLTVDLSASPFTNTLALHALKLDGGASGELTVAYITAPELTVTVGQQRYTCVRQPG